LATVEEEPAEPTWSIGLADWFVPAQKKCKSSTSAFHEHENYAHRSHNQMLFKLTCWPFDFMAQNMPNVDFGKIVNNIKASIKASS
jgi:hypothetical protein